MASSSPTCSLIKPLKPPESLIKLVSPGAICEVCQHLLHDVLNDDILDNERWSKKHVHDYGYGWCTSHHGHPRALISSIEGCCVCQSLVLSFSGYLPSSYYIQTMPFSKAFSIIPLFRNGTEEKETFYGSVYFTFSEAWSLHSLSSKTLTPLFQSSSYDPYSRRSEPIADMSWLRKCISNFPDSPICHALASRWIGDCFQSHPECHVQGNHSLPTRVLNVGCNGSSPFLYVSDGQAAPYITLSHCWGGAIESRCTSANIIQYQVEVAFPTLPKTFRDAISVARQLGYQYLWIDALCIVQDDHDDWTREAAMMGEYYRNAALTISAGDSRNSNDAFLKPRSLQAQRITPIGEYAFPDGSTRHLTVQTSNAVAWLKSGQLERRGWTLQERVLSPRKLYFTDKAMVWECPTAVWHENSSSRLPPKWCQNISNRRDYTTTELTASWGSLIEKYSSRALSEQTDKLPAISGLAAMYGKAHGGVYLAGLWEHDMPAWLLWSIPARAKIMGAPPPYRAPSWSWASVDALVEYPKSYGPWVPLKPMQIFTFLEANVQEDSPGSLGQVNAGHIIVTGALFSAYYRRECKFVGALETILPGLSVHEIKYCVTDYNSGEREYWVMPCMIRERDRTDDSGESVESQGGEESMNIKRGDHRGKNGENTQWQSKQDGEESGGHADDKESEQSEKRGLSDKGEEGEENQKWQDDNNSQDRQNESHDQESEDLEDLESDDATIGDPCLLYMLVLEETTETPERRQSMSCDRNEIRTFKRIGLAHWQISLLQLADIEAHEAERIRID